MPEITARVHPISPLYVNERRLAALVGAETLAGALRRVREPVEKTASYLRSVKCAEVLRDWLEIAGREIPSVQRALLAGSLRPGRLVTYEGHLWCRNAAGRRRGIRPVAHTKIPAVETGRRDFQLELLLHPGHLVVGSAGDLLTGKVGNLFALLQTHSIEGEGVAAVPVLIGNFRDQGPLQMNLGASRNELFVDHIENFERCAKVRPPSTAQIGVLRDVPEEQIKFAFSEIVGEPDVPKDWGGERSDLYTTYLTVAGQRASAAFLFKGPAGGRRFRPMEVCDLGVRGDQIERLVTEPAEILVVQHCHKIGSAVRNTLRAFCSQIGHERRFCLISGYDTFRILKAYGKCGV